jgi:hypothetical protein
MVRLLRIFCVITITFILLATTLTFLKSIHFIDWINYFKIAFSLLIFSLVYLLLDTKRTEVTGKLAIFSAIIGFIITILSVKWSYLNNLIHIPISLYLISFILIIYSKLHHTKKGIQFLFLSILLLPLGILLQISNTTFYLFSITLLVIITSMVIYQTMFKKVN